MSDDLIRDIYLSEEVKFRNVMKNELMPNWIMPQMMRCCLVFKPFLKEFWPIYTPGQKLTVLKMF